MKNEIKLNIHMFFPEQLHDEISAEQHKALETLLALPELDQEDSVEKFTSELASRFELIKPILGDQTEEFLGYKQEDIDILTKFFSRKFVESNKEAFAATYVQMILKKIWLQTPCDDKRLNYDLYEFIDEKFDEINYSYKRILSFNNWDASKKIDKIFALGVSLQALKFDWEMRKKRYGELLNISNEFLDEELFTSPTIASTEEYAAVEFLNFWMPYLCQCPFEDIVISDKYIHESIGSTNNKSNIEKLIYVKHVSFVNTALRKSKDNISWLIPYKKYFSVLAERFAGWEVVNKENLNAEFNNIIYGAINGLDVLVNVGNVQQHIEMFARDSKKIIYEHIKQYFRDVQQTYFGQDTGLAQPSLFDLPPVAIFKRLYDDEEFGGDLQQLPHFINQHNKYFIYDQLIKVVSPDYAFCSEGKNYFYPNRYIPDMLSEYDKLFTALEQHVDEFHEEANLQTALNYFTRLNEYLEIHYENLVLPKALKNAQSEWIDYVKNMIGNKQNQILVALSQCYYFFKKDAEITPTAKQELLYAIGEYFNEKAKIFVKDIHKNIENIWNDIEKDFESFSGENKLPDIAKFRLCDELKYICDRDKFEREREELKLQAKEADVREKIFQQSCHQMGNLSQATSGNLDLAKQELEGISPQLDEYQYVFDPLNDAKQDIDVILQYATSISNSYRDLDDNWQDDLSKSNGKPFVDIIRQALHRSILHVFYRDITAFCHAAVSEEYFSTRKEMDEAKKSWQHSKSWDEQCEWIEKNLFALTWDDDIFSQKNFKVSNEHLMSTHLFTLFYEIFLNAVKAVAYSPKESRCFSVNFVSTTEGFQVKMSNSIGEGELKASGGGSLTISNYMKKFQVKDFFSGISSEKGCYEMSFTLPLGAIEEDK